MEKEIFLVEELENRLAVEGVKYKHEFDENWEKVKFDPSYFDTFISGPLYAEFITAIYDRIKPLNNQEINRFLTLSVAQFKTHTPEKRERPFILNYWHTYWFPNKMDDKVNGNDEKYAKHILKHYTTHFHLFKEATEKALEDFQAGRIGTSTNQNPVIKNEDYQKFLKDLEYNYPLYGSPVSNYHQWKYNLSYLKKEILDNLINLEQDKRKPYLNRLKVELEEQLKHCHTSQDDLNSWYIRYKTTENDMLHLNLYDNPLHVILNGETAKYEDIYKDDYNLDTHHIQDAFYNFHYGQIIREAIEFITQQLAEYGFAVAQPKAPENNSAKIDNKPSQTFNNITSEKNAAFILQMLEDMTITVKGKSNLSERRKGAIRGVVEASKEKNILPQIGLDVLCSLLAANIGLELKAKLDHSTTSEKNRKAALKYIAENYKA